MDACTVNSIRMILIGVALLFSALGIWTFHAKLTCRSQYRPAKTPCIQRYSILTIGILGFVFGITQLYLMNQTRQSMNIPDTF